jgi:hypothetical protein
MAQGRFGSDILLSLGMGPKLSSSSSHLDPSQGSAQALICKLLRVIRKYPGIKLAVKMCGESEDIVLCMRTLLL